MNAPIEVPERPNQLIISVQHEAPPAAQAAMTMLSPRVRSNMRAATTRTNPQFSRGVVIDPAEEPYDPRATPPAHAKAIVLEFAQVLELALRERLPNGYTAEINDLGEGRPVSMVIQSPDAEDHPSAVWKAVNGSNALDQAQEVAKDSMQRRHKPVEVMPARRAELRYESGAGGGRARGGKGSERHRLPPDHNS